MGKYKLAKKARRHIGASIYDLIQYESLAAARETAAVAAPATSAQIHGLVRGRYK